MKKMFRSLVKRLQNAAEKRARAIVFREFLRMSDRQLEDIGISRDQRDWPLSLQTGNAAVP